MRGFPIITDLKICLEDLPCKCYLSNRRGAGTEQLCTLRDSLRTPLPSPGWFFLEARHLPCVGEEVTSSLSAFS